MKRIILTLAIVSSMFISGDLFAQTANEQYIEVHGKAEKSVTPDKITLSISINERNYRNRTLEQLETDMVTALKNIGIDVQQRLKTKDMTSTLKKEKAKKQEAVLYKSYTLELQDATTTTRALLALEEVGVSNVVIEKFEYSAMDSLKLAIKAEAVKNARKVAETMTDALGQKLGKAFYIYEQDENVTNYRTKSMMFYGAAVDAVTTEEILPEINFQEMKVTSRVTVRFQL